ncbi:hypothetical protein AS188_10130 [Kocuria flava]|uniref:Uncharacterized protein n=1 Tax=Kocuria flava TaxID=446860 RepID=A0A0U3HFW2_9MICC|nr:hypothetical protein [Kocuria flava]ALU40041.1 hypothetical protein AS188_10130 [Kocuria flava]GEO91538.1 hypothetical protein KFL01_08440 [Kocuria flava]
MPFTPYRLMTAEQARAALEEFLAERPRAWSRLRAELAAHGFAPDALLDGSPASLTPLWQWIESRRTELAADPAAGSAVLPRRQWPSWARHTLMGVRVPSSTMDVLLDGLVSYLAIVVITGAPTVRWGLGSPEDPAHHLHHHPVLLGNGHQVYVPTLPLGGVLRLKRGERSLHATELERYAEGVIADLRTGRPPLPVPGGSPVVVVAEPEGFDVGVHAAVAARGAALVDLMALELARRPGVDTVHRRAADALLVHAPAWDADALERWLNDWMKAHGPFVR